MIKYRQMPNMPIREHDAKNMIKAYGPDTHALKGKTVRRKAEHVPTARRFSVPPEILNANSDVVLCTDIFFVDSIPFLLAVSRNIRHVFVEALESRAMVKPVPHASDSDSDSESNSDSGSDDGSDSDKDDSSEQDPIDETNEGEVA